MGDGQEMRRCWQCLTPISPDTGATNAAYEAGRLAGLEEAAALVAEIAPECASPLRLGLGSLAQAIRALKDKDTDHG